MIQASSPSLMSLSLPTSESSSVLDMSHPSHSSSFQLLLNVALQNYTNRTGLKLLDHPFARQLETRGSVDSIYSLLQELVRGFRGFREDGKIMKPLKCAVHVLHGLSTSTALGEGIGLVRRMYPIVFFSPPDVYSKATPTRKGSVCCFRNLTYRKLLSPFLCSYAYHIPGYQAARDVSTSYDALVELFESIERFLRRLDVYTRIPLTAAMADIVIKILTEVLTTLALATKQVKEGRLSQSCHP